MGEEPVQMISGVIIQPLRQIEDERGKVMHMLRKDSDLFLGFGEVYFSLIHQGKVKAWKKHLKMTQHFAVPVGKVRIVIYDERKDSPTYKQIQEVELGEGNYSLIRIPPFLWYGILGIAPGSSLVANCANLTHDPQEAENLDSSSEMIPYFWVK